MTLPKNNEMNRQRQKREDEKRLMSDFDIDTIKSS